MNKLSQAAICFIFAVFALPSFAQGSDEMRPHLSINYDHVFQDKERASGNGNGYSLSAGMALDKYWGAEVGGFYDQFQAEPVNNATGFPGASQWRSYGINFDALFFYSRNPAFSPYTVLSLGAIRNDLKNTGASSTDPFGAFGVGFMKYFKAGSHDLGLRADVRYRWAGTRDIAGIGSLGEPVVKIGLVIPLGAQ
ncbi:MAG: outer membrane beta-barrel protein [Stenotrophobium sp.]